MNEKKFNIEFSKTFIEQLHRLMEYLSPEEQAKAETELQKTIEQLANGELQGELIDMEKLKDEDPDLYEELMSDMEEGTIVSDKN